MTALALSLLLKFWPVVVAVLGYFGFLGYGKYRERQGVTKARAESRQKAAEELHEMDREATEAERKARDLSDEESLKEGLKWRKSSRS